MNKIWKLFILINPVSVYNLNIRAMINGLEFINVNIYIYIYN